MKQLQVFTSFICILFLFSFTRPDAAVEDYIAQYSDIAIKEMHRTGVPASITLAQGIIESRFGTSGLAKNSNNHFGIKCKGNWQGGKYYHKDDDYDKNGKLIKSCFRTYENPEKSYYDHSDFLLENSRYRPLFALELTDYKGWAKGLKKCGYATAKNYATSLITTIEKYQLHLYDYRKEAVLVQEMIATPQVESIPEFVQFTEQEIVTGEVLVAQNSATSTLTTTPPPPSFIPDSYRVGDGKRTALEEVTKGNFEEDVFGTGSIKYLDEIRPQLADRN